jgi:hypothetical protein
MSIQEYEEALHKLNPEELKKFNENFGGGDLTIEQRVRNFVDEPQHEARMCQLLNLKTEAQKITDATVQSAEAAVKSASSAKISMICSIVACIVAIVASIVAVFDLITN